MKLKTRDITILLLTMLVKLLHTENNSIKTISCDELHQAGNSLGNKILSIVTNFDVCPTELLDGIGYIMKYEEIHN